MKILKYKSNKYLFDYITLFLNKKLIEKQLKNIN